MCDKELGVANTTVVNPWWKRLWFNHGKSIWIHRTQAMQIYVCNCKNHFDIVSFDNLGLQQLEIVVNYRWRSHKCFYQGGHLCTSMRWVCLFAPSAEHECCIKRFWWNRFAFVFSMLQITGVTWNLLEQVYYLKQTQFCVRWLLNYSFTWLQFTNQRRLLCFFAIKRVASNKGNQGIRNIFCICLHILMIDSLGIWCIYLLPAEKNLVIWCRWVYRYKLGMLKKTHFSNSNPNGWQN